jgi:hypothetical protein
LLAEKAEKFRDVPIRFPAWIPAFAGMTEVVVQDDNVPKTHTQVA